MATIAALLKKGTLEAIVAAWQQTPAVTLLELADRYEQAHPGKPFDGDTADFREQATLAKIADRGPLLKALVGPKSNDTLGRLEAVAKWEPDPRTSRAMEQLLRDVPYTSDSTRAVWTAVFRIVANLKDPRFVPLRQSLVAGWKFRENHRRWMTAALERATEGIPDEVPELEDADEAAARALAAKLVVAPKAPADKNEEGLLADVYANPDDDGPRLVYADWLQERGDPRGEFIALQCAATRDEKREAALLKAHGAKWLGPLAAVTTKGTAFRRGFPAVASARFKHQKDVEAHGGSPAWATIEELSWSSGTTANDSERWQQFVPPAIRARKIRASTEGIRQLLALGRALEVEELTAWVHDVDVQRTLAASDRFPKVTRLTVSQSVDPALFAQSWMGRVKHVAIDRLHGRMEPWLVGLRATAVEQISFTFAWLGELTFARPFSEAVFTPERGARPDQLRLHKAHVPDSWLASLDPAQLEEKSVRVTAPKGTAAPPASPGNDVQRPLALGWIGKQLCVAEGHRLFALDAATHPVNSASAAAFSPDGKRVALAPYKKVELRDPLTGVLETSFPTPGNPTTLQFDETGTQLLVVSDGAMQVYAVPSGAPGRKLGFGTYPKRPVHAAFSPDGTVLAAALYSGDVVVYPPGATRAAHKYPHGIYTNQVLFLSSGRFVTSCRDGNVRLFDLAEEEPVVKRHIVESPVLLLSPDRKTLLASGGTKTRILDAATLEERGALDEVLSLPAFSPDGKRVAGVVKGRVVVRDLP